MRVSKHSSLLHTMSADRVERHLQYYWTIMRCCHFSLQKSFRLSRKLSATRVWREREITFGCWCIAFGKRIRLGSQKPDSCVYVPNRVRSNWPIRVRETRSAEHCLRSPRSVQLRQQIFGWLQPYRMMMPRERRWVLLKRPRGDRYGMGEGR